MRSRFERVVTGGTGLGAVIKPGERLRVTDLEGRQVVDISMFNAANVREKLSTSYSRSRAGTAVDGVFHPRDRLSVGDLLVSTINREMMRITADTPEIKGMHDVHGRMCNRRLFRALDRGERNGCHEIISAAVAPYGLLPEDIPDTFDIFMNFHHDCANRWWTIEDGCSRPGDYVEFEAVMECLVGLSNCPFFRGTPVKIEVFAPD